MTPNDEPSYSVSLHPDKEAKISYIPRRLVIGNDEYIRIGNGNKLIRNPKKRTRILASEKVRWSLHTARMPLARKRKYFQSFTRLGKCNKENGKFRYIHDPSKLAVCTKFLNGLRFNTNCKLTHKVITEKMTDCSYFLQGICTNQNCPYRHVSVNPKASSCEEFLRGYTSDDEPSCSVSLHPDKEAKICYTPRRLVIGNDEYIRIGNGNQLIRNPKKRTRILASEKVRWSLHTARMRLARKRKYCQFFTRFGKCNEEDGKCPYIHDPYKVAVCTKFLNGLCFNTNCKLTHKVIPERMPDCSYFLQGLCTNQNCPYRHVSVNPKASTCEEFLRGYCADGNECRKKHSYVCPNFEATGTCPQGSKCKLHHPKNRTKGKKRKRTGELNNVEGRYFGSMHVNVVEPVTAVSEKLSAQEQHSNDIASEGKFADFIRIDVSDDEAGESNDWESEQTTLYDGDLSQFQLDDLDELIIKPVRIMDKNLMT